MTQTNTLDIFKNGFKTLVKPEYIDNLAYYYGYTKKIFTPVEGEVVEVTYIDENWQEQIRQEPKMELVDNPVEKLDFVCLKVLEFMENHLSEKIKEWWAIKLEIELEKAREKLKNLY